MRRKFKKFSNMREINERRIYWLGMLMILISTLMNQMLNIYYQNKIIKNMYIRNLKNVLDDIFCSQWLLRLLNDLASQLMKSFRESYIKSKLIHPFKFWKRKQSTYVALVGACMPCILVTLSLTLAPWSTRIHQSRHARTWPFCVTLPWLCMHGWDTIHTCMTSVCMGVGTYVRNS